jgi:lambda family phage portal protein
LGAIDRVRRWFGRVPPRSTEPATFGGRGYDGASRRGRFQNWNPTNASADATVAVALPVLRARSRDLVRNNPLAAQAVQVLVNNIVGTGIRPRAAGPNKAVNKKADALWKRWSMECDAHGHTDFHGLTALAVREMIEGGDIFALNRPQKLSAGLAVPLLVELREAEHLDAAKARLEGPGASRIVQGIETDPAGRRTAFWMFNEHPGGDASPYLPRSAESSRIPAERVAHLFERQRTQARGVPWAAPIMRAAREMDEWQEAEIVRKKTEACLAGIVIGEDGTDWGINPTAREDGEGGFVGGVMDGQGNAIETFRPGMLAYLSGGKDIKFTQPAATGGVYEWQSMQMHVIAAGFRVPYALMTGDLKQTNFSSGRMGLNEFRRMVEQLQWQTVIPMFCDRIWRWFIEAAQLAGKLPEGDVPAEWAPPRFESVNPLQDATADLLEVRAGFATTPQNIAKRGYDPAESLEEQAAWLAAVDAVKIVLDSDPRRVTKVGMAQPSAPAESEPPAD